MVSQIVAARDEYTDYTELGLANISFSDGEEGSVYVFEARYNDTTPNLKFVQTARVCYPERVYAMTITLPAYIREHQQYIDMLATFSCNYPEE